MGPGEQPPLVGVCRWWIASAETIASNGPSGSGAAMSATCTAPTAVAEALSGLGEHRLGAVEQFDRDIRERREHRGAQQPGAGAEVEHPPRRLRRLSDSTSTTAP